MRVLVLDDDPFIIEILGKFLTRSGHTVIKVTDTDQARNKIHEYQGSIDLLISDICLPGESGILFIEKLKQQYPYIDVVLMTGLSDIIASDVLIKGA
ncbi:MAG: response regulator, partial [Desulfobacterales bacterium]|nr:response regulator [Desulfobacterales bacterium]